jgi:ABC-2 type transport system ATP-binding protein
MAGKAIIVRDIGARFGRNRRGRAQHQGSGRRVIPSLAAGRVLSAARRHLRRQAGGFDRRPGAQRPGHVEAPQFRRRRDARRRGLRGRPRGVAPLIEVTGGSVGDLVLRENVGLTAGLHGISRLEVNRRFDGIIEFSELHDFVDTADEHLADGMKVRLAFFVVSQLKEPILLVDEVLAIGDNAFRVKCYARIDGILAGGCHLLLVSPSESDLRLFCTRGLYLYKERSAMDAPIAAVLDRKNADYHVG